MLGPVDYALWFLCALCEACAVVFLVRSRSLSRYFPLGLYLLCSMVITPGRFFVVFKYGLVSPEYIYFYY